MTSLRSATSPVQRAEGGNRFCFLPQLAGGDVEERDRGGSSTTIAQRTGNEGGSGCSYPLILLPGFRTLTPLACSPHRLKSEKHN